MHSIFQRGMWAGCPGFHAPASHLSFTGISRAKNSLGASAEIVGQSVLLTTQKFAGGGGWSSPPDFMPVRVTEDCMCSEQLLAFRRPWVVTWCLVCYRPSVAEEAPAAGADHMALETRPAPPALPWAARRRAPVLMFRVVPAASRACHSSQFRVFASGATRCFCSKSPGVRCTPLGCLLSPPPSVLHLGLCVSKAGSTASGVCPCGHSGACRSRC